MFTLTLFVYTRSGNVRWLYLAKFPLRVDFHTQRRVGVN
jgi:hypothetical protein